MISVLRWKVNPPFNIVLYTVYKQCSYLLFMLAALLTKSAFFFVSTETGYVRISVPIFFFTLFLTCTLQKEMLQYINESIAIRATNIFGLLILKNEQF